MRKSLDLLVPALAACGLIVALDQGTKALATSLGLPVVVADPDSLTAALESWMDRTPHGR